jgi:hypothetical protein
VRATANSVPFAGLALTDCRRCLHSSVARHERICQLLQLPRAVLGAWGETPNQLD